MSDDQRQSDQKASTFDQRFQRVGTQFNAEHITIILQLLKGGRRAVKGAPPIPTRLKANFTKILQEHHLFVEREEAQAQITKFLAGSGGYLFIKAPAGYGKTALLAHLVNSNRNTFHYHFFSRRDVTGEREFQENLAQQLLAHHGLTGRLPQSNFELRALCIELLQTPAPLGQPLVIVLDALDEASFSLKSYFVNLGFGVYVIFSARPVANQDWLHALGLTAETVERLTLKAMTWTEMQSLLRQTVAAPLADDVEVMRSLELATEGDPFFVRILMDDVQQSATRFPHILRNLDQKVQRERAASTVKHPGLWSYLKDWWDEARKAGGQAVDDILCYLAVALSPLTRSELIAISRTDALRGGTIDEAVKAVQRFITGGEEIGYVLCHPRFQEYVTYCMRDEIDQYREALLAYCARWKEHHGHYALQHYAMHLREAERWGELFSLARDNAYWQAQATSFPTDPNVPLWTVQTALQGAAETDNAGAMAEFLLLHAQRLAEITHEDPLEALRAGNLKRAWKLADLFDFWKQILWYLLLAWELKDTNRIEEAQVTLRRLDKELQRLGKRRLSAYLGFDTKNTTLTPVERLSAYLGFDVNDFVQQNIDLTPSQYFSAFSHFGGQMPVAPWEEIGKKRASFYLHSWHVLPTWERERIAYLLVHIRDISKDVFSNLQQLLSDQDRYALCHHLITHNQLTIAWWTAKQIGDIRTRMKVLRKIEAIASQVEESGTPSSNLTVILERAQRGDQAGVGANPLEEIAAIKGHWERIEALKIIAATQFLRGERISAQIAFDAAQTTARRIREQRERARALKGIAAVHSKLGEFAAALDTAQWIDHVGYRTRVLREILAAQVEMGKQDAARVTLATMLKEKPDKYKKERVETLRAIAMVQIQAGAFSAAMETVQRIDDLWTQAHMLGEIGAAQSKTGEHDTAQLTFDAALATVQRIGDRRGRGRALKAISVTQARVGMFSHALDTAQQIWHSKDRAKAIKMIAILQAQIGVFAHALETVQRIKQAWMQAETLGEIAAALQTAQGTDDMEKRAQVVKAISLLQATAPATLPSQFLGDPLNEAIAVAQAQAGQFAAALQSAREIKYDEKRTEALHAVAIAQARAGQFAAALRTAEEFEYEWDQAEVLRDIAVVQAQLGVHDDAQQTFTAAIQGAEKIDYKEIRAEMLREITVAQKQAGAFADAPLTAQEVGDEKTRDEIWRAMAEAEAQKGAFTATLGTAQRIGDKRQRAEALGVIAVMQAQRNFGSKAIQTAEAILAERNKLLPTVAQARVEVGDRANFKHLLIPCAYYQKAAYSICGLLARVYPEQATLVAKAVIEHTGFW